MNQIVLRAMFAKLGVTDIMFADNGREALDILTNPDAPKFDFVLTDMWMPEMDGLELVKAIRSTPAVAKTKVYLFTAEVEMKDSYRQNGFDGILLKPANLEALRNLLP
jgi:two-component system chemotaxis response regulator CheY